MSGQGGICLAKLRLDGFASIEGGAKAGTLTTRPLDWTGGRLTLNTAPRAGGQILVEVLDRAYQPIDGYALADAVPVTADGVREAVGWRGANDLSGLTGRTIRLRFHITDASLYSFSMS